MSVIYSINCTVHPNSAELAYTAKLDSGFDLMIEVEPCAECIEDAREEGRGEE